MSRAATKAPVTQQGPRRLRSEQFATALLPGYRDRIKALADADGDTIAEWLERQVERCELEAEMRGTVATSLLPELPKPPLGLSALEEQEWYLERFGPSR